MALETGTYVHELVETNPVSTDGMSQTDDHLRLIKKVLKRTFPNIKGAMNVAHAVLNALPGRVEQLETDLMVHGGFPVGTIIMWYGTAATVPTGWQICDGTNGTPDLRGKFVKGCASDDKLGVEGGNASPTTSSAGAHNHSGKTEDHTLTVEEIPPHHHGYTRYAGIISRADGGKSQTWNATTTQYTGETGGGQPHSHGISTDGAHTHTVEVDPPHRQIYYIMKVA